MDIVEGEERGETGAKVRILMLLNEVCFKGGYLR